MTIFSNIIESRERHMERKTVCDFLLQV